MSVNDVDIDVFNGVLTDAANVVVAADVTPGSTVQTSKHIKEQCVHIGRKTKIPIRRT